MNDEDDTRIISLEELAAERQRFDAAEADNALVYVELRRALRRHVETEVTLHSMQIAHDELRTVVSALVASGLIAAEHLTKLTSCVRTQATEIEHLKIANAEALEHQEEIAATLDRHAAQIEQQSNTQSALVAHITDDITGETR